MQQTIMQPMRVQQSSFKSKLYIEKPKSIFIS